MSETELFRPFLAGLSSEERSQLIQTHKREKDNKTKEGIFIPLKHTGQVGVLRLGIAVGGQNSVEKSGETDVVGGVN